MLDMQYTPAGPMAAFPPMRAAHYCIQPSAPCSLAPDARLTLLLCRQGGLRMVRGDACPLSISGREILLFSDAACFRSIHALERGFDGLALFPAVLTAPAAKSLPDPMRIRADLEQYQGAVVLRQRPWIDALFSVLSALPAAQQQPFCVLKAYELLYLLGCRALELPQTAAYYDEYQLEAIRRVEGYMRAHLGERMTIPDLSTRFRLSPTLLKSCFRQLYGEPVHTYLRRLRLEQAAALLASTSLSVLQIANAVGYGSVSQFGTAFKQRYHMSPIQYRRAAHQKNV